MKVSHFVGLVDHYWARYALYCARSVLHIYERAHPNDHRVRKCIETMELCLQNLCTREELERANNAATRAAWDARASWDASRAASAASAASDVWAATSAAASNAASAASNAASAASNAARVASNAASNAAWAAASSAASAASNARDSELEQRLTEEHFQFLLIWEAITGSSL